MVKQALWGAVVNALQAHIACYGASEGGGPHKPRENPRVNLFLVLPSDLTFISSMWKPHTFQSVVFETTVYHISIAWLAGSVTVSEKNKWVYKNVTDFWGTRWSISPETPQHPFQVLYFVRELEVELGPLDSAQVQLKMTLESADGLKLWHGVSCCSCLLN